MGCSDVRKPVTKYAHCAKKFGNRNGWEVSCGCSYRVFTPEAQNACRNAKNGRRDIHKLEGIDSWVINPVRLIVHP